MEHNYIEYLKDMRNDAIDEILTYANGDIEYYFEEKAEAYKKKESYHLGFFLYSSLRRYHFHYRCSSK